MTTTNWMIAPATEGQTLEVETQDRLNTLLATLATDLAQGAGEPSFTNLLVEVYGAAGSDADHFSQAALELIDRLQRGDGLGLRFQLATGTDLAGALAAYAASGADGQPTIYLNADWLAVASDADLRLVLLEEIGHHFDTLLNAGRDSSGDEGELFAALFSGIELTPEQRDAIQAENDNGLITVDGQIISTEQAISALSITSVTDNAGATTGAISNNGSTDDKTLTVSGSYTSSGGSNNTIYLWGIRSGTATYTQLGSFAGSNLMGGSGTWSITTSSINIDGTYTLFVNSSATTPTSTPGSGTFVFTLDGTAPSTIVTINSISLDSNSADFITNDSNGLTINATLSTGLATGEILQYSNNNGTSWTNINDRVSGTSVAIVDANLTSTNTILLRVIDQVGNIGPVASQLVTIDTTAPAPAFTSAATTSDTSPVISGTAEDGSIISLTIAGATYTTTATGGVWSIDIGALPPSSGSLGSISANNSYTISVTATDAAGNSGSASQTLSVVEPILKTVTIDAISLDSGLSSSDFITNDNNGLTISATLSDSLSPGESLQYSNNNGSSWTNVTSSVSGTAVSVQDASLTTTATIQFRIANSASGLTGLAASQLITIDTTAPTIPAAALKNTLTLDAASTSLQPVVVLGWLANNQAQAPTLTQGDVIEIFDTATDAVLGRHLITAGNLTGGKWNANTTTVALTGISGDDTYNLKVRIADRAGNAATASVSTNTFALVIDTTAPATPVLALGTGVENGASTTEATQASGVVTVTAESGSTVAVTFSNGSNSVTKSVAIPASGSNTRGVTLTSADLVTLGDGIISVSATATDGSGNTSTPGTTTFLLNPSITVNAVVVDPDNLPATLPAGGFLIATFTTNIDLNTVDVVPVESQSTLFTIDEAKGDVFLTQDGLDALNQLKGLFTVNLKLVASTNTSLAYDQETDYLGGLQTVTPSVDIGAGFPAYLSFAELWIGTATDKDGDPLSAANPNQFNYFKATSPITEAGGWFVAAPSDDNNVGNNTYGTLHYRDGSGALITIDGTLSRVYKENGNDIQAIYFYPGTDFPTPDSSGANLDLYMLDLYGSTRGELNRFTITADTVYKTSSDTLDEFFFPVTVNSITVNEASPWAVFTITSVEYLELSLAPGRTSDGDDEDANTDDFTLQYSLDGGATWIDYTWDGVTGSRPTIPAGGTVLVRVDITSESDADYEGAETFTLVVSPQGGGEVAGIGTIVDDGTGDYWFDDSTDPASPEELADAGIVLDDDRVLTVTAFGPVNEGSTYAMFAVNALPGEALLLQLGKTSSLTDKKAASEAFTFEYFDGENWTSSSSVGAVPGDGIVFVRVNISSEQDTPLEGPETFTLTASYTRAGERTATGISTIIDNGSGNLYSGEVEGGKPIVLNGTLDDDRSELSIPDVTVNEASPYVVFQISGVSGQTLGLSLSDGDGAGGEYTAEQPGDEDIDRKINQQKAVLGSDYTNEIQVYINNSWQNYDDAIGAVVATGSSLLLVRVRLINDDIYEGAHAFTLTASPRTGTGTPVSGRAIIGDFSTGAIFNDSGAENRSAVKDDDRKLKVDSPIVNEGSEHVVFQITGITDAVQLSLAFGNGTGFATLPNPNLQYWTGLTWANYPAGATLTSVNEIDSSNQFTTGSTLYVRVAIGEEQDDTRELAETFILNVTGTGGPSQGTATIRDDGTGLVWLNGSFIPATAAQLTAAGKRLDDDYDKDGITPTTEDALSTLAVSQGIEGKPGDLNGDGIVDAEQNALATLAWRSVDDFSAGNDGTLTDIQPIISLKALGDADTKTVSDQMQLEDVRVASFDDSTEFGDATQAPSTDANGNRTVTLANGDVVLAPWDPIRFVLAPQDGVTTELVDISERPGTQVRIFIDMRASGLDQSEFNRYIKFVSEDAITAAGLGTPLRDLDGAAITREGWYDFTQRTPGGDGARFIIENGKIVGIEMIITDNAFGDNDPTANRILDPGVGVKEAGLRLIPTDDGLGLKLIGPEGAPQNSLWLDLSAVLANAFLQNSYNLIRRTPTGPDSFTETAVGAIGATRLTGFLGDTRVQLTVGEELRFALQSNNGSITRDLDIQITGDEGSFVIALDDSGFGTPNDDYNDLVLQVNTSLEDPAPRNTQMAQFQTRMENAYLDLRWIAESGGTSLAVDIKTNSSSRDLFRLVKVDTDANGNPLGTVGGFSPRAGSSFNTAVRNNLLPSFSHSRTSPGTSNLTLNLTAAQAGVYAPVVITPLGQIYTFGLQSSSDRLQHVKTLGANSFGFELQSGSSADWSFDDMLVTVRSQEATPVPRLTITSHNGRTGLTVTGFDSARSDEGLWVDLNAVTASTSWQNNLDLVKRTTNGTEIAVGTVGATANTRFTGSRELFLQEGEILFFRENSNDNTVGDSPLLRFSSMGERIVVAMDDRMGSFSGADGDFNDLVINVDSSIIPPAAELNALTTFQRTSADGVLDLSTFSSGATLHVNVINNAAPGSSLRLVKLEDPDSDNDPLTGLTVNNVTFNGSNRSAFLNALTSAPSSITPVIDPITNSDGSLSYKWTVNAPGYYAPVLITSTGNIFTLGDTTASDGRQHLKLLGDNTFGFEVGTSFSANWSYDDLIAQVTLVTPL